MNRIFNFVCVALLGLTYAAGVAAAQPVSSEHVVVRVGYAPLAPLWAYPVIHQAKLWKPYLPNVEVQSFVAMTGMGLVNNMLAGKTDIAYFADMPAIVIASKSNMIATKFVALDTADDGGAAVIYVGKNSPIRSVKELNGKRVSVPFGGYTHRFAEVVEATDGVKFDLVGQSPEVGLTSLRAGKVDAFIPWPPYGDLAVRDGYARELINGASFHFRSIRGTIVSQEFANKHPEVLIGWLRAQLDALKIMRERPAYAARLIAAEWKAFKVPVPVILKAFSYMQFPDEITPQWREVLIDGAKFLRAHKFIKQPVDINTFIDDKYLKKAAAIPSQLNMSEVPEK